jgi:methylenetetrahydrofolate dehydrogenase (NADP+) / methenyltetrahydrofolate cyclohydrolase
MIIDGKQIAQEIKNELKLEIEKLISSEQRAPGLGVILVGDDPASQFYVSKKQQACAELGINSFKSVLEADCTKDQLISVINSYNLDKSIDAILLQLPLPAPLRAFTQEILDCISPNKDVDGLTTVNLGKLFVNSPTAIYPCTPKGCMELLKRSKVDTVGKRALVLGRSLLVGKPLAIMLSNANATVTLAHSQTLNLADEVKSADIIVAAIGKPEMIPGDWIKPGAVVIDVGINSVISTDGSKKILGDVEYSKASQRASLITPVPGGVGPMTVAMLLMNTFELWKKNFNLGSN